MYYVCSYYLSIIVYFLFTIYLFIYWVLLVMFYLLVMYYLLVINSLFIYYLLIYSVFEDQGSPQLENPTGCRLVCRQSQTHNRDI